MSPFEADCAARYEFSGAFTRVEEDDLPTLGWLASDPEVVGLFNWDGWTPADEYRKKWRDDGLLGDRGILLVVTPDLVAGFVSWHRVATGRHAHCWNIGINLRPDARGQGYGTEAQSLLVRYLFAYTVVNRIEAVTEVDNAAEQRSLEPSGFTREGTLRGYCFRNGRWLLYSILRTEVEPEPDSVG